MSKQSKDMRTRASRELRESRNGGSASSKADNFKRAAAYKTLAENEEWLAGEQSRRPSAGSQPPGTQPGGDAKWCAEEWDKGRIESLSLADYE